MAQRLLLDERQVWLKLYGGSSRRITLGLLGRLARTLSIDALRPPPHHGGKQALCNEMRRLGELKAAQVNVPAVLEQRPAALVLADVGASLSKCLKRVSDDPAARDRLVSKAIEAIADVHAKGLYLGNPSPRNMTFDNECIGFLDFEEDPGEVMALETAQVRDWLLFVYGVARHFPARHADLAGLLEFGLERANPDVRRSVLEAGRRLDRIAGMVWPFSRGNGKIRSALRTLRYIAESALLVVIVLANTVAVDDDGEWPGLNLMGIFS